MPPPSSPISAYVNGHGKKSFHMRLQPNSSSFQPSPVYAFHSLCETKAGLRFQGKRGLRFCSDHELIYDEMLERRECACIGDFTVSGSTDVNQDLASIASGSSDVDGDMEPALFNCKRWRHGSSSPFSSSSISCEGRLHVTSAASECSVPDDNDDCSDYIASPLPTHGLHGWCAEERKVDAAFLAPGQKALARRRKRKEECMEIDRAVYKSQPVNAEAGYNPVEGRCDSRTSGCDGKQNEESMFKDEFNMPTRSGRFVYEALTRLQGTFCKSSDKVPCKDPTDSVQDRLQNLLLAAQTSACEHKRLSNAPSELEVREFLDRWSGCSAATDCISKDGGHKKECNVVETAAHMDFLSLELAETKAALAWRKKEYRGRGSRLGVARYLRQTRRGEEMYCKEVIRKIVAQVQAETEQWSEIENILGKLREEIDGLNKSQKIWEDRALKAEAQLVALHEEVHQWRCQAQSAEEELALLRSERQILKNKVVLMEGANRNLLGAVPTAEEMPRPANVGMQPEDYVRSESFVHSRNESGRSSVDLGVTSQRSFRKSIKKAFDFANNGTADSNTAKFWLRNPGAVTHAELPKQELVSITFSSSKKADLSGIARNKYHKASNHAFLNSSEPTSVHDGKERKKARLFTFKENRPAVAASALSLSPQDGFVGLMVSAGQGYTNHPFSKSKSSLPSAPASTPSRLPFGDILNLSTRNVSH